MYIRIHHSGEYQHGNSGSCSALVSYLEKENKIEDLNLSERTLFFNHQGENIASADVANTIDKNVAKLGKDEARFYMISINPSQEEQRHIAKQVTGRSVNDISELTLTEKREFEQSLQYYTQKVMNEYARGFNRMIVDKQQVNGQNLREFKDKLFIFSQSLEGEDKAKIAKLSSELRGGNIKEFQTKFEREIKNITDNNKNEEYVSYCKGKYSDINDQFKETFYRRMDGNDLVYFGKVEHQRHYDRLSEQVKNGERKPGELKEGFQSHVHIVVSRKDNTNTIRLSPFANAKNAKNQLNGREVQIGFNRKEFVMSGERIFDDTFNYERNIKQSFAYHHSMKRDMATLAGSYLNQMTGGAYYSVASLKRNAENLKDDPLKVLSGLMYKNPTYRNSMKIAQMAAQPQKVVLEIAKKLPQTISQSTTIL